MAKHRGAATRRSTHACNSDRVPGLGKHGTIIRHAVSTLLSITGVSRSTCRWLERIRSGITHACKLSLVSSHKERCWWHVGGDPKRNTTLIQDVHERDEAARFGSGVQR